MMCCMEMQARGQMLIPLTDEAGKLSGRICMLIEKGLSSWYIGFGPYINLEPMAHTYSYGRTCTQSGEPKL